MCFFVLGPSDDDEDDFFDAIEEQTTEFKVFLPPSKDKGKSHV